MSCVRHFTMLHSEPPCLARVNLVSGGLETISIQVIASKNMPNTAKKHLSVVM